MVVSSLFLLFALSAMANAGLEMFGSSADAQTCAANVNAQLDGSYPTMLIVLLIVGPLASIVLLVLNIVMFRFIRNKLVAETEVAMQKCFEVLDNVLVELMPRKIQKQLQAAINGGKGSNKNTETKESEAEKDKEGGEQSAASGVQSAASAVSAQK